MGSCPIMGVVKILHVLGHCAANARPSSRVSCYKDLPGVARQRRFEGHSQALWLPCCCVAEAVCRPALAMDT